eukprot:CAMPEP_0117545120 /NCGR_PEP_ID=MMETSP0784-20121206/45931_1 /TAXON_ID=39447 /ORGANISM="" /LENGTH=748 /DNA_ID=CAMNT_0005341957 /DNA_START=88 /DNA_END=2335 /DNA_ORIENTATION=+
METQGTRSSSVAENNASPTSASSSDASSGYNVGDEVVARVDIVEAGGHISVGEVGVVLGPCSNGTSEDSANRVVCAFPKHRAANLNTSKQLWNRKEPLAEGYKCGEEVVSCISFEDANGRVSCGDIGVILGPCSVASAHDSEKRVLCAFPGHRRCNPLALTQIWRQGSPLAAGYHIGDVVVSCCSFEDSTGKVSKGDVGQVVGPCSVGSAPDRHRRIQCRFPRHPKCNPLADSQIWWQGKSLANGFNLGDEVVSCMDFEDAGGRVSIGEVGIVAGPCSALADAEPEACVMCTFHRHAKVKAHAFTQICKPDTKFPGGYKLGDEVVATCDYIDANGSVTSGDVGVIIGPSSLRSDLDREEKVLCRFPTYARFNAVAELQLQRKIPTLAGGHKVGDEVVACFDFKDAHGKVSAGEVGTIVGPCTLGTARDQDRRVLCRFPRHPHVNPLAATQIWPKHKELVAGYHIGDKVMSCIDFDDSAGKVNWGDVGIVMGPCSSASAPDRDRRVMCRFPHHKRFNPVAATQIRLQCMPLIGGNYGGYKELYCELDDSVPNRRRSRDRNADVWEEFKLWDANGSGGISCDELKTALRSIGMTRKRADRVYCPTRPDGRLNVDEFMHWLFASPREAQEMRRMRPLIRGMSDASDIGNVSNCSSLPSETQVMAIPFDSMPAESLLDSDDSSLRLPDETLVGDSCSDYSIPGHTLVESLDYFEPYSDRTGFRDDSRSSDSGSQEDGWDVQSPSECDLTQSP